AQMKSYIFIPADLEQGKILATLVYNPTLVAVEGTYDEVNRLCSEIADKYRWAFVNVNFRPYYSEGAKSYGFEIVEQLGLHARDEEIIEGMLLLARTEGIFTETAGGVTVAATKTLIETGVIPRDQSIVVCITGNGLKTPDALYDRLETHVKIRPTLSAFDRALTVLKSQGEPRPL